LTGELVKLLRRGSVKLFMFVLVLEFVESRGEATAAVKSVFPFRIRLFRSLLPAETTEISGCLNNVVNE